MRAPVYVRITAHSQKSQHTRANAESKLEESLKRNGKIDLLLEQAQERKRDDPASTTTIDRQYSRACGRGVDLEQ